MSGQNNEQALKDVNVTLSTLAAMVSSIMNKLESKTSVSEPKTTANNQDVHRNIPKSPCDTQDQSPTTRVGTSNTLPVDAVEDTSAHSEGEEHPLTDRRVTRSKDAKLKAIPASQENSEEGVKPKKNEKALKKGRVAKGGAKKRGAAEVAVGQPKPRANAIRVTEDKLNALKGAVEKRKGGTESATADAGTKKAAAGEEKKGDEQS